MKPKSKEIKANTILKIFLVLKDIRSKFAGRIFTENPKRRLNPFLFKSCQNPENIAYIRPTLEIFIRKSLGF